MPSPSYTGDILRVADRRQCPKCGTPGGMACSTQMWLVPTWGIDKDMFFTTFRVEYDVKTKCMRKRNNGVICGGQTRHQGFLPLASVSAGVRAILMVR